MRGVVACFAILAQIASALPALAVEYPVVEVTKKVSPLGPDQTAVDMLDSVTLTITLKGDTRTYPDGVETAVVLVLDESGSMDGQEGYSRSAAKAVIGLLKPSDKVGLVAFDAGIKKKVALTTSHASVTAAINGLDSPDGGTNALLGVTEANAMLAADKTAIKRAVIFFTDGVPTPLTQMDDIGNKVEQLNQDKISYYTVAFGNFLKNWLKDLAEKTGGDFCDAASGASIATCFTDAFKAASQTVSAQDVWINEVLAKEFEVLPGTLSYSMGGTLTSEPPGFKAAMQAAAQTLYKSGELKTPPIFELPSGRTFDVSFDISPTVCKDTVQQLGTDNIQKTYLSYDFGPKTFQITYPDFNQVTVPVNRCGVYVAKRFEQTNRVIEISLRNAFTDRNVYDVHLKEVVGPLISPRIGEATPSSWGADQRIVWPTYPPGEGWRANGVEWRLFESLPPGPSTPTSPYPPYGYTVTSHHYIKPSTEVVFKLPIDARAEAEGKTNVLVNEGWKPAIEGGPDTGSILTFWYKLPYNVPEPKQEVVEGLTYRYYYESLSGESDWSKKRHVVIHLPDLTVPFLKPEWPYAATGTDLTIDLPDITRPGLPPRQPGPFQPANP